MASWSRYAEFNGSGNHSDEMIWHRASTRRSRPTRTSGVQVPGAAAGSGAAGDGDTGGDGETAGHGDTAGHGETDVPDAGTERGTS